MNDFNIESFSKWHLNEDWYEQTVIEHLVNELEYE